MPRAELDSSDRAALPLYCRGMYVEREFPEPLGVPSGSFPARLRGDRVEYTNDGSGEIVGRVTFEQGNRRLAGERAVVREVGGTREVSFPDGLLFTEPGLALTGTSALFEMAGERGRVEDVDFVLFAPEFRGAATLVERRNDVLTVESTRLTRCAPGIETWRIEAGRIDIAKGDAFARARNVVVRLKGVPVFYSPRLRVPVSADRQTGFLFPDASLSPVDLAAPFYLNLAPNYDATLTPRHVAERGTGLTTELRHLNGFAETEVVGAILPDDRRYAEETDLDVASDRWLSRMRHRGRFGDFTTLVDYTAVSDSDYFRDLGIDQDLVGQGHLRRFAEIRYANGGLSAGLSAQAFQMLEPRPEPHRRVPTLDLTYGGRLMGALGWTVGASWTAFDPSGGSAGNRAQSISGERAHVESRVQLPFLRSWGFLKLGAGYRYTSYELESASYTADATPERAVAFADADGSLFFDRDLGESTVWTLEPRAYYLYQGYEAQEALPLFDTSLTTFSYPRLFRRDRFSGLDRIGDANQLSVGVTSRLLDRGNGRERIRASIGRIRFFEDQRVTLRGPSGSAASRSASAFAGELAARMGAFTVRGGAVWDPERSDALEFGVSVRYRSSNNRIFNLARRLRRDADVDQGEVSAIWPLGDRWSTIGKWNYDVENARSNEVIAGFGYASCCWQARLLYRRLIEPAPVGALAEVETDEGVLVQFVFRGLAGVGGRVETLLSRGIPGYREERHSGTVPALR